MSNSSKSGRTLSLSSLGGIAGVLALAAPFIPSIDDSIVKSRYGPGSGFFNMSIHKRVKGKWTLATPRKEINILHHPERTSASNKLVGFIPFGKIED